MKKYLGKSIAVSLSIVSLQANANYECVGKLNHLAVTESANVVVALTNGVSQIAPVHVLCGLKTQVGPVDTLACKAWYATLLSSKLADKTVHISYTSSDSTNRCASIAAWSTPGTAYYLLAGN
jgi:hypothetical protein